ncbi:MAG: hypothetical protein EXR60_04830 [Dehalococcoidia bacterium]|nr:hypothetical protein [Dehalococcoidia bacterium]
MTEPQASAAQACPRCSAAVPPRSRFCWQCGESLSAAAPDGASGAAGTPQARPRDGPQARVGLALELGGLAGFLGLGWVYAGQPGTGIILLLVWWLTIGVAFVLLAGAAFFSRGLFVGLLAFFSIVWLAVPLASAWGVLGRLRRSAGPSRNR